MRIKNKKLNIAVVGIGVMGLKHIDAIKKNKNVNLTAVVDLKRNKLIQKIKANFYSSIEEMFKFEKIEGVILSTPNASHLKDSLKIIKNNCPVLIEKPITLNSPSLTLKPRKSVTDE